MSHGYLVPRASDNLSESSLSFSLSLSLGLSVSESPWIVILTWECSPLPTLFCTFTALTHATYPLALLFPSLLNIRHIPYSHRLLPHYYHTTSDNLALVFLSNPHSTSLTQKPALTTRTLSTFLSTRSLRSRCPAGIALSSCHSMRDRDKATLQGDHHYSAC